MRSLIASWLQQSVTLVGSLVQEMEITLKTCDTDIIHLKLQETKQNETDKQMHREREET